MKVKKLIEMLSQSGDLNADALLYVWDTNKGWMMAKIDKVGYHEDGTLISGDLTLEQWQDWQE